MKLVRIRFPSLIDGSDSALGGVNRIPSNAIINYTMRKKRYWAELPDKVYFRNYYIVWLDFGLLQINFTFYGRRYGNS